MIHLIVSILAGLLLAPLVGGLLSGIDRIISARMQQRRGPPLLQPFYDVGKLLRKKTTTVNIVTRFYILLALMFVVSAVVLLFAGQDLLLSIFAFTLGCIFFVIAGYSSYSPFSFIGSERELLQIMCYEPMLLIAAFGFYKATGTFSAYTTTTMSAPAVVQLPLIFLGLAYITCIKLRKSPFDLSTSHHGHQEIVKGITTEIGGTCLALVEIKHWFETVFILSLVYIFFLYENPYSHFMAVIACLLVYFCAIVADNVFARFKWKRALLISWVVIGLASMSNFIILGLIIP